MSPRSATGKARPAPEEMEFYEKARRSVHAAVDIPAGTVIEPDMLTCKRPGYGIRPVLAALPAGAARDIAADEWITWRW